MEQVFKDYLAYSAGVRHFSEKTIEAYRNDLKLFSDWLAENALSFTEVSRTQVRIFVADLGNRHFAPASINRTLSCVRGLYRYALRKGLCTTNPAAVIRNLKQPDKLPRFLFPDEAERFCEFPKEAGILWYARDAALFSSLYSTGCRAAELQGLKITDLREDCSWAIVRGKGNKERKVFFADFAREAVLRYLTERAELIVYLKEQDGLKTPVAENALFLNCRGGALTTQGIRYIINRTLKNCPLMLFGTALPRCLSHVGRIYGLCKNCWDTAISQLRSGIRISRQPSSKTCTTKPTHTARYEFISMNL